MHPSAVRHRAECTEQQCRVFPQHAMCRCHEAVAHRLGQRLQGSFRARNVRGRTARPGLSQRLRAGVAGAEMPLGGVRKGGEEGFADEIEHGGGVVL